MARGNRNQKSENENLAPEGTEMLNDEFTSETEATSEFGDFINEAEEIVPDESEMAAAYADAAKDAEGTDLESDESDESEEAEEIVAEAVNLPIDMDAVQPIVAAVYENAELDDMQKNLGRSIANGYVLGVHMMRNSILDIHAALARAHFSEAHDDVFARAEKESAEFELVRMKLERAKEARAEYEATVAALSEQLKQDLGIKPLSDEDRKGMVEEAKVKQGQITVSLKSLADMNAINNNALTPVIEYINSLPALPPVTPKTETRKIGAKSAAGEIIRARLGYANGGGIEYKDKTGDNRYDSFTSFARDLKSDLEMDVKANDITHQWIRASGVSNWQDIPVGKDQAVTMTLTNEAKGKTVTFTVIKMAA